MAQTQAHIPTRRAACRGENARRVLPKRTVFAGFDLALLLNERSEVIRPEIEFVEGIRVTWQILCLVIAVILVFAELNVLPQLVWHFDSALSILRNQGSIGFAIVFKGFVPPDRRNCLCARLSNFERPRSSSSSPQPSP